jgi:hypothetical protein
MTYQRINIKSVLIRVNPCLKNNWKKIQYRSDVILNMRDSEVSSDIQR